MRIFVGLAHSVFLLLIVFTCWYHQNKEIITPSTKEANKWCGYRDHLLSEPNLIAFYSFQDEYLASGLLRNRRSILPTTKADIALPASPKKQFGRMVEGHWPGKQAIELDQQTIRLPPLTQSLDTFSLTMWIRHNGIGSKVGANVQKAATIICLGDGVWSGWRIDLLYPSNRIIFHIARGKTNSTVGVTSSLRVPPKTWTQIGISREKDRIRIYVNGLLTGETRHDAPPTQLTPTTSLQIGYAGNGLSSASLQIAELSVWSEAKSEAWFLALSLNKPEEQITNQPLLASASHRFIKCEYATSLHEYLQYRDDYETRTDTKAIIEIRLSEIYQQLRERHKSSEICERISDDSTLPIHLRCFALHQLLVDQAGVDFALEPSTRSNTTNYTPIYNDLAPAPEEYINALIDYDFETPAPPICYLNSNN